MKRVDSNKKTVFISPKKAEIIFALPSLAARQTYYSPTLPVGNGVQPLPGTMQRSQSGAIQNRNVNNNNTVSILANSNSQRTINQIENRMGSSQKPQHPLQQIGQQQLVNPQQSQTSQKGANGAFINLERDNYAQDIARRKVLNVDLHSNLSTTEYIKSINGLAKVPKKKTRRHKTKFHILKTNKNIEKLQGVICDFISDNKKYIGSEQTSANQQSKNQVFAQSTLDFADQLVEDKQHFKEKFGLDENNLRRNKCVLEHVVLNRMEKRVRNREKNEQLKKVKQMIQDQQLQDDHNNNNTQDSEDIVSKLEKPADRQGIPLTLPKIQEDKEDEN